MSSLRSLSEKSKDEQRTEYLNIIQQQKDEIKAFNKQIDELNAQHEKQLKELNAELDRQRAELSQKQSALDEHLKN